MAKLKLTRKQKSTVKAWVEALRSGKYKQGRGTLYVPTTKQYCCLGVLCRVTNRRFTHDRGFSFGDGDYETNITPRTWFSDVTGLRDDVVDDCVEMNDADGKSFKQIAARIATKAGLNQKKSVRKAQ